MRRSSRSRWTDAIRLRLAGLRSDEGTTALEFVVVGVLLLVPLAYLVITLGIMQGHAMGVESASRHLARTLADSRSGDPDEISAAVVGTIVAQYGMDPSMVSVSVACGDGGTCPRPGVMLRVTVSTSVPLPLVPPVFGLERAAAVPIESTSVQRVSVWG